MQIISNASLAEYTSFGVGGTAERLVVVDDSSQLPDLLSGEPVVHIIGYGTNYLIADAGLPGLTVVLRTQDIDWNEDKTLLIADSGVWWDDVVQTAINEHKWGLELMSGIPGSVGGAVVGNIAAYGQAVSDTLSWIEVIKTDDPDASVETLEAADLQFSYRYSALQAPDAPKQLIVRAAFAVSDEPTVQLAYQKALSMAESLQLDPTQLADRRSIILAAREAAGSLQNKAGTNSKTGGSFFRNPMVTAEQADQVLSFEEGTTSKSHLKQQNAIHGGDSLRVSAAHVLLAAGFTRGQQWGDVRLHPDHVLKIENVGSASAQEIYDVADNIVQTVHEKLGITLEPEVRFLGDFTR